MTDTPKRVELVLDKPRSIFYDFRVGKEWENETYKMEMAERKDVGLPTEDYKKRPLLSFLIGSTSDMTTMLWVMFRRSDQPLTLEQAGELVNLNNQIAIQDAIAAVMGITILRKKTIAGKEPTPEELASIAEAEAKNSNLPTGSASGPSEGTISS